MVDLVKSQHLTCGRVEFVMVDLEMRKRVVECKLNIRRPRRILDDVVRHGDLRDVA